jgi:ABC-type arginine transport system permease subunit
LLQNIASLFDFRGSVDYLPDLLQGALVSIELTACVMLASLVLGLGPVDSHRSQRTMAAMVTKARKFRAVFS